MADEKDDEIERLRSMLARAQEKREDSRIKRIITGFRRMTTSKHEEKPEKRKGAA
jgi:hypothetical protein